MKQSTRFLRRTLVPREHVHRTVSQAGPLHATFAIVAQTDGSSVNECIGFAGTREGTEKGLGYDATPWARVTIGLA